MAVKRSRTKATPLRRSAVPRAQPSRPTRQRLDLTVSGHGGLQIRWAETIDEEEWGLYRAAIEAVRGAGIRFMLGGGFALATFTGRWRDTKDIDFYIHPRDREAAVAALNRAGFADYYERLPYDRKWIYRSVRKDVIVDIIWSMANQRAQVDEAWFERAGALTLRSQQLLVVPREEFMWCKLYILQRDHCDWTDLFNLLYATGGELDWEHLLERLGEDVALLRAMLTVYGWLCPIEVTRLPRRVWNLIGMCVPRAPRRAPGHDRIRLLDSRCWFAALQPVGQKLEV